MAKPDDVSFDDRRTADRRGAKLDAIAVMPEPTAPIDCVIEDMNRFGARLDAGPGQLPDTFFLLDMLAHAAYAARVVWRRASHVGVQFERSYFPSLDACPEHVGRAYLDRLARDRRLLPKDH